MQNEIRVEIGGIGLLVRYKNCRVKQDKDSELYIKDFIRPGKDNPSAMLRDDFIIDVAVDKLPEYPIDRMLFEARENWRLYESKGKHIFETHQSHGNEDNQKITRICVMEKDLSRAEVYISPLTDTPYGDKAWSLERLMKIMGQLIVISVLHRYQDLLIHSSGIILNGEGIIFCGVSGAGKTTLAKLLQKRQGVTVLSDDRLIVRENRKGYFVYGSPWPGEGNIVSSQRAPLKKIFFLSKAKTNKLISLEKRRALQRLITQCFPAIWDEESIDFSLKLCGALVEDIPCFNFGFVPDESAVEFIEKCALS